LLVLLSNRNENRFTRSFQSFRVVSSTVCIEYDASLTGIGLYLSNVSNGQHVHDIGCGRLRFPFNLKSDSSFQNVCEFIAVVIGITVLVKLGYANTTIALRGDGRTSLKWGSTERFKGVRGLSASVVYLLIGSRYELWVSEVQHLPKEYNTLCDSLSRDKTVKDLGISDELDLKLDVDSIIHETVCLCNPTTSMLDPYSIQQLWISVNGIISRLPPI